MESIISIIENSGAPKILVLVGLALFILSIVRQITWLQLLESSRAVARYTGIAFVAVGVYLEYADTNSKATIPEGTGKTEISGGIVAEGGDYIIHFMSLSHQSSAHQQLAKIKKEHANFLKNYKPMIDVVKHPEDGRQMYRVNFGIFQDKDEADQLCLQMLRFVDHCVPRERGGSIYVNLD